jgi:hypothetical protein
VDAVRRFLWTPIGWFSLLMVEFVVLLWVYRAILPEHPTRWVVVALLGVLVVGWGAFNLWFRRRFLSSDEQDGSDA